MLLIDNPLNSELAFPIIECFHIAGFVLGIGSAALVDFCVLGFGLKRQSASDLARDTTWWTLGGLLIAIFAGMLLYSTDPDKYYLNTPFVVKTACLAAALVFHFTVRSKAIAANPPDGNRVVSAISLGLWISVVVGGMVTSFTAV